MTATLYVLWQDQIHKLSMGLPGCWGMLHRHLLMLLWLFPHCKNLGEGSLIPHLCFFFFFLLHPMLLQWHVKDPGHSAKSAGCRLHQNMHIPLTHQSQSGLTILSRHSVRTYLLMYCVGKTVTSTKSHLVLGESLSLSGRRKISLQNGYGAMATAVIVRHCLQFLRPVRSFSRGTLQNSTHSLCV